MSNSKNVFTATDQNLDTEVLKNSELTMVDFWAAWCGPCKALAPTLDVLADEFSGRVKIYKLNVDENPTAAQRFKIRSIPTILFLKNGEVVDQIQGNLPKDTFVNTINKHI
jgi:thioredoxin 1